MNYCGNPISDSNYDSRFLETYDTIHSKPIILGYVEKDYKYNPDNDVDISLGIKERKNIKEENTSFFLTYYLNKFIYSK
jgi:hypothetical protein